ncbi:Het-C domain-containing protein [Flavobacterium sp. LS1R49]|uniref:Het-C domain-containing protein n=1 Tax=Flavobacterium shii TaxID=2987687 RepID=A0A9X3BX44_9FLAO|nr:Het-C domain-containing protein [Flavobacterium shii]MCV9926620.1 Het-C domain-containing protein [Flavobacterium shii]
MSRIRIVGGKIIKTTGGNYNMYAKGNIVTTSAKTITEVGVENGITYGEPKRPPKQEIIESKYKLESTYAHEQLSALAKQLDELPFMFFMVGVFGEEIEASALSKLYRGLSDKSITPPEIVVTKFPARGRKANYSNHKKKILVWEHFVDLAVKDNDARAELMSALVEEYGHHIDNILRTELATNGIEDTDYIDEGAKFAYALFNFDIFKETQLCFAKVETPNFTGDLIIDFSELHTQVKEYVGEDKQYDANPKEDEEGFGAGFEAGMHGGIEREALIGLKFTPLELKQIYYGNWLRDYSQIILESTIRLEKPDIDKIKQSKIEHLNSLLKMNPYKMSHDGWVKLLEILAAKEFVFGSDKFTPNYKNHVKTFQKEYGELTKDILGIYRPEEHIDNPKGLKDFSSLSVSFQYEYPKGSFTTKKLYAGEDAKTLVVNGLNLKNYIATKDVPDPQRPTSDVYMFQQLKLAVQYGKNKDGFRHLGAAFHVLEDFFSHTNFVELALIKAGSLLLDQNKNSELGKQLSLVYPWVQDMKGADYNTIPIVTGKFLLDDTMASVLPKAGDKMFPVGIQDYVQRKPGDRTFQDAFILTTLEDLSTGQQTDGLEKDPVYMGMKSSELLNMYQNYLKLIDIKAEAVEFSGWLGRTIDRGLSFMGDSLATFNNIAYNLVLGSIDDDLKIEQTENSNKNYGTDPTHTQIAKDALNHPLNPLASELAKIAVKDVATRVLDAWETGSDPQGDILAKYVIEKYTLHPVYQVTDWANEAVNKWAIANEKLIFRLQSATVYEHAEQVTQRTISNKKTQEILNYFK